MIVIRAKAEKMKEFDIIITPSKDNIEILLTSAILFTEIN